jgi:trans-2-enoyl-CoA reductase
MKAAQFAYFGSPLEVIELDEIPDPPPPGNGEVSIDVMFAPVNPGDLLAMEGRYGATAPKLPNIAGVEGLGRVTEVGEGVTHVKVGDRVLLPPGHGTWCEKITAPAAQVSPLPDKGDPQQLCMMRANPAAAYMMLTSFVALSAGDWIVQNAANSGAGQYVIELAKLEGIKSVNIVRRPRTIEHLKGLGADVVVVYGPDLAERISAETGGANIKLGIDAVAGKATQEMARCLAVGGTIVNYGLLSGEPCMVDSRDAIFRDIQLRGFWRAKWQITAPPEEISRVSDHLSELVVHGKLRADVEAVYPLWKVREALHHAQHSDRMGKILLQMND